MKKNKKVKSNKAVMMTNARKCMGCNSNCWRSDVNYCWDCYKYQMFESR